MHRIFNTTYIMLVLLIYSDFMKKSSTIDVF